VLRVSNADGARSSALNGKEREEDSPKLLKIFSERRGVTHSESTYLLSRRASRIMGRPLRRLSADIPSFSRSAPVGLDKSRDEALNIADDEMGLA
jgi:hypothetical protein